MVAVVEPVAPSPSLESFTRDSFRGPRFKCNCNTREQQQAEQKVDPGIVVALLFHQLNGVQQAA